MEDPRPRGNNVESGFLSFHGLRLGHGQAPVDHTQIKRFLHI